MLSILRRFAGCERGLAALEMALVTPFLVLLLFGGFEMARYLMVQQKVEKIAFSLADITAQYAPDDGPNIPQVFAAVEQIMKPLSFKSNGRIILTSVTKDTATSSPKIRWQCMSGDLTEASKVGKVNETAKIPSNLLLDEKDSVIVSETFYRFTPVMNTLFRTPFLVYRTAVFRPRLGALTSAQC